MASSLPLHFVYDKFLDYKQNTDTYYCFNEVIRRVSYLEQKFIIIIIIIIIIIMHEYNNYNNDNRRYLIDATYFDLSRSFVGSPIT
jgi:hypothetical protein